ncbi:MAG: helix-turn-helix domain-containing protein [Gemmatimonadaceae bacterium]
MSQGELAEELGTVREVVVRALRELRADGVIRSAGSGRIEVLDATALARRARTGGSVDRQERVNRADQRSRDDGQHLHPARGTRP